MADVKMGALFLLTALLQSFVERSTAVVAIRFVEDGQNYTLFYNESFEDVYSEYYEDSSFYDNGTLDYYAFEKIPRHPKDSAGPLHPCRCVLSFISLLHTLPIALRVLDARR